MDFGSVQLGEGDEAAAEEEAEEEVEVEADVDVDVEEAKGGASNSDGSDAKRTTRQLILYALTQGYTEKESLVCYFEGDLSRDQITRTLREERKKPQPLWHEFDEASGCYAIGPSPEPAEQEKRKPKLSTSSSEGSNVDASSSKSPQLERDSTSSEDLKEMERMCKAFLEMTMGPEAGRAHFATVLATGRQRDTDREEGGEQAKREMKAWVDEQQAELKSMLQKAKLANAQLIEQLDKASQDAKARSQIEQAIRRQRPDLNRPMSRVRYAEELRKLLGRDALKDQDVFHIIANSRGGADHPDNYLYALGSTFNRSIGDQYDELNCFLAGMEKTKKAIEVSMRIGNKPRNGKAPIMYKWQKSSVVEVEAAWLFGKGQALMSHIRAAKRAEQKAQTN